MSLINEALKRAQHQRKVDEAGFAPPIPGGSGQRVTHRGKPMASQTLLLIVAGSAAIIVLTVVATVYLMRGDASPAPVAKSAPAVTPAPAVTTPETKPESAPAVVLSIPAQPAAKPEPAPARNEPAPAPASTTAAATAPVAGPANPKTPEPPPAAAKPVVNQSAPPVTAPVAMTPVAPSRPPVQSAPTVVTPPDQQVLVYLDNLRILGVRFSGLDSKVLIGDRVFRVNDVIERNFGLRLVEVQPDKLFFVDARGVAYTKNL